MDILYLLPYAYYLIIPIIVIVLIVKGVGAFFNNNKQTNMNPNQTLQPKPNGKDIFYNIVAFASLYTLVVNLLSLLFNVIEKIYVPVGNTYYSSSASTSISWPVAILVVFLPIFLVFMYLLERMYRTEPDLQKSVIHRGMTYITLFISGSVIAGDLITTIYYFIDGRDLTNGFLLKVIVLLVVLSCIFLYFIYDLMGKLTAGARVSWRFVASGIVLVSIVWGFAVIGSPRTQRLLKYDEQKVSALQSINNEIKSYYSIKGILPVDLAEMTNGNYYVAKNDPQTQKPYVYQKTGNTSYDLCVEFNKASPEATSNTYASYYGYESWIHPLGHYCFNQTINPASYYPPTTHQSLGL